MIRPHTSAKVDMLSHVRDRKSEMRSQELECGALQDLLASCPSVLNKSQWPAKSAKTDKMMGTG